jgi:dTDP-4-dehydrorhamnose reductase
MPVNGAKSAVVFGAYGLVGGSLMDELHRLGVPAWGIDKLEYPGLIQMDVCDRQGVRRLLEERAPALVFLPAAITNVDYCEQNPELTYQTNVLALCDAILASRAVGAKVIFFSSDYIFDGTSGPYAEDYPANPLCAYGIQKLIAEHFLSIQVEDYLIIRTTAVYGWEKAGKNFAARLVERLGNGQAMKAPIDQIATPTYAPALAEATCRLALEGWRGVFNVVGVSRVSRYEFACDVAQAFDFDAALIEPVTTDALGQIARRPLNGGLKTDKLSLTLPDIALTGHRQSLQAMRAGRQHQPREEK